MTVRAKMRMQEGMCGTWHNWLILILVESEAGLNRTAGVPVSSANL